MSETPRDSNRVMIFDTTLRDGEQAPGISLNSAEKLEIAQQLARLKVDVIEAGFPINSPPEFEAVQGIARCFADDGPVIAALARPHKRDIDAAWNSIKDAQQPRIHTFISSSDIHIRHQMQTTREDVRGQVRAGVAYAKQFVDDVEYSPMDATRADDEFTAELCSIAIEEGATVINIPDTVGYAMPGEMSGLIKKLKRLVPAIGEKGVLLSVHCHDDLDLATATSFEGLMAGARQVHCTVNGIGERAGNAQLAAMVMLLHTRKADHGLYTGINTRELGPTSLMVSSLTGYEIPNCSVAVTCKHAFQHEAGIHVAALDNDRSTFEIMDPLEVGMDPNYRVLGKHSGKHSVEAALKEFSGYEPKFFGATLTLFRDFIDKAGEATKIVEVTSEELYALYHEAVRRQVSEFKLVEFKVDSTQESSTATVTVKGSAGNEINGSATSNGDNRTFDGPVDALFTAINNATETNFEVDRDAYHVDSIGTGKKTLGLASVGIKVGDKTVTGRGLSSNTLEASGWAYLDAISRALEVAHRGHQNNAED